MIKYQGENIDFTLEFQQGENPIINDFSDFSEITAYLYTDTCYLVKFSYPVKEGYCGLSLLDNLTLTGTIPSSTTKAMAPGLLFIEINAKKDSANMIDKKSTGILIYKDLIKLESDI